MVVNSTYFETSRTADKVPAAAFLQCSLRDGSLATSLPAEPVEGFLAQWMVGEDGRGYWERLQEVPAGQTVLIV